MSASTRNISRSVEQLPAWLATRECLTPLRGNRPPSKACAKATRAHGCRRLTVRCWLMCLTSRGRSSCLNTSSPMGVRFAARRITDCSRLLVGATPSRPPLDQRFSDTFLAILRPLRTTPFQIHSKVVSVALKKLQILDAVIVT